MNLFHDVFLNKIVNTSLNATYIALIPKKSHCNKVSNLRSISLTTSVYKMLAKVLSERLKQVLLVIIAPQQFAFVHGRQIMDPIIITNAIVDYWKCRKQKGVVIKLDIKKAFDKINWSFLLSILNLKGFHSCWIEWIQACISSVNYSVILNGKPRGFIKAIVKFAKVTLYHPSSSSLQWTIFLCFLKKPSRRTSSQAFVSPLLT